MKKYLILFAILHSTQIGMKGQSLHLSENIAHQSANFSPENKWCLQMIDQLFFDNQLFLNKDTIPMPDSLETKKVIEAEKMKKEAAAIFFGQPSFSSSFDTSNFQKEFPPRSGDLFGRKILKSEKITGSPPDKQGTVVLQICVDQKGEVVSSQFSLKGSTTTDKELIDLSIENIKKWVYEESLFEQQCGKVTYQFRLR